MAKKKYKTIGALHPAVKFMCTNPMAVNQAVKKYLAEQKTLEENEKLNEELNNG